MALERASTQPQDIQGKLKQAERQYRLANFVPAFNTCKSAVESSEFNGLKPKKQQEALRTFVRCGHNSHRWAAHICQHVGQTCLAKLHPGAIAPTPQACQASCAAYEQGALHHHSHAQRLCQQLCALHSVRASVMYADLHKC